MQAENLRTTWSELPDTLAKIDPLPGKRKGEEGHMSESPELARVAAAVPQLMIRYESLPSGEASNAHFKVDPH